MLQHVRTERVMAKVEALNAVWLQQDPLALLEETNSGGMLWLLMTFQWHLVWRALLRSQRPERILPLD